MDEQELEQWVDRHFWEEAEALDVALDMNEHVLLEQFTGFIELTLEGFERRQDISVWHLVGLGFNLDVIEKHFTSHADERAEDDDDDDWDNDGFLTSPYVRKPEPEPVYAAPKNDYKTPSRYYSVAGVKQALEDSPELLEWLKRTKGRRAKENRAVRDQIALALGATIAVYESSRIINGSTRKVRLYQLMDRSVKAWNTKYWQRIKDETLPALDLHSDDERMRNQVHAVTVRSIRDEMTDYALIHRAFLNKPGLEDTTRILRIKTAVGITQIYPVLARAVNYVFYHPEGWDNPPVNKP